MKQIVFILLFGLISLCGNSQTLKEFTAKDAYTHVIERDSCSSVLIDGRSESMFSDKHIEGAINIDAFQEDIEVHLMPFMEKEQIIVYCSNQRRAELIIDFLHKLEFSGEIIFINDGINGWIASGYETVSNKS